jgi:hypothetical protein
MQQLGLSPGAPKSTSRLRELLWPDVRSEPGIKIAVNNAMWACFIIALFTTLVSLFGNYGGILDALLFAGVGFGIRRRSRIAAICGLTLYLLEQLYAISQGAFGIPIVPIIIVGVLLSGVRATTSAALLRKSIALPSL